MSLHVGANVDVVAGNYEGQRGTVTKLTAQQVYVDLSSGDSVRIAQTSVCVRSGAVTPPGAGTPPGARAGPAVPPVTQQQSRRSRRPMLTVSEDSSLKELRDFIDRHDLPISKGVGGRSRRTKDEMFAEIQTVWEHEAMDTASDDSTAERPLPPRQTRSMTGDAPGMRLFLGGYQKVSLQDHFRFVLHDLIGGVPTLMRDAVGAEGNRLCAAPGDYVIDEPSSKGLAHLLGLTTVQLCTAMARGVDAITDEIRTHGTADDVECLLYVLEARAGSSDKRFANGVRDEGRQGEMLDDFVQMQEAVSAGLEREEVLALRLYTTVAYLSLNAALRDPARCSPPTLPIPHLLAIAGYVCFPPSPLAPPLTRRGAGHAPSPPPLASSPVASKSCARTTCTASRRWTSFAACVTCSCWTTRASCRSPSAPTRRTAGSAASSAR